MARTSRKSRRRSQHTPAESGPARPALHDSSWFWPVVIAALAVFLRMAYVFQIRDTPFFQTLGLDARFYDRTAWAMLSGRSIEGAYFMSPLYSWFLAGLYRLFGRDLLLVRLAQSILGAGTAVLTYTLARRVFDRRVGVIAGLIAASYGAFIFYDGSVLMTPLLVFLSVAALVLLVEGEARERWLYVALSGATFGLAAIGRASALVFVPVAAVWLLTRRPSSERGTTSPRPVLRPSRLALLLLLGAVVVIAPVTVRNYAASGDFVPITSNGGLNFYIGNSEIATGGYEKPEGLDIIEDPDGEQLAEAATGRELSASEVSSYWYDRATEYISAHPEEWAALLVRKLVFAMSSYELPQLENYYFQKRYSPLLTAPLPGFAAVAPLGLVGLALAWRRRRARLMVYFVATYVFSIVVFFVVSRYRLPVVPALIAGASYAVMWFVERWRKREWRRLTVPVVAVVALAVLVNTNLYGIDRGRGFAQSHYRLGLIYGDQGKVDRAMAEYQRAISIDPEYEKSYLNLGALLAEEGRNEDAVRMFREAIRLDPDYTDARINLAIVLERDGDYETALAQIDTALSYDPENARALKEKGIALLRTGHESEAKDVLERALQADRGGVEEREIRFYLGTIEGGGGGLPPAASALMAEAGVLIEEGRVREGLARLEEASRLAPTSGEPLRRMAEAKRDMGLLDEAIEHIEQALAIDPSTRNGHFMLGVFLSEKGEHDAAVVAYESELRINENYAPAHLNLGLTYQFHLANPNRAMYHYRRYLELGGSRAAEVRELLSSLSPSAP